MIEHVDYFQEPSRNIACRILQGTSVSCDLGDTAITERQDCPYFGDWGHRVLLNNGRKARMICASDTLLNPDELPVLPYGASTRIGSITCTSARDGVRCADDHGHGFRLAKSSYEVH